MPFKIPIPFFIAVFGLMATTHLTAQHCPFDGYYAAVIHINDKQPPAKVPGFYLLEKEDERKDSCRFTARVDSIRFLTEAEIKALLAADPQSTRSRYLPEWLEKYHNFLQGNRVVLLTLSQRDCMVAEGNNYHYLHRQFVIRYSVNGRQTELKVPPESVYYLCGTAGSWKRIKPLEIDLHNE